MVKPSVETPQSPRSRAIRAVVIKTQEGAAAAAAVAAANSGRGGRVSRASAPSSNESTVQMLLKLPGFAWGEDDVWQVNNQGQHQNAACSRPLFQSVQLLTFIGSGSSMRRTSGSGRCWPRRGSTGTPHGVPTITSSNRPRALPMSWRCAAMST